MNHLTDKQLLNMLTDAAPDHGLAGHVAQCDACADRLQALQDPWEVLGQWTLDTPDIDVTDRVLTKAQNDRPIVLQQPQALIRIAASILIGVGVGFWMEQSFAQPVSDEQVTEAMYLDVLTLSSSTGLTSSLLEEGQE